MRIRFLISFLITFHYLSFGQDPTLGLIHKDENLSLAEGYVFFAPETSTKVYLINQCGEKIQEWTFEEEANRTAYLREDGSVVRAGKEHLSIRDWDNTLRWKFNFQENNILQHHDIEPLPNGNILVIAYDYYDQSAMEAVGYQGQLDGSDFILDRIVELKPIGTSDAEVVWEWKLYDHLVQDKHENLENYGVVSNHPGLIDVNVESTDGNNFSHMNGIDYNADLDQILFSLRNLNEIYIIDHSTSTAEAATAEGGLSGKGGNILWRWGNPSVYQNGSSDDKRLFRQHDPKWVQAGFADEGKISVFNNQFDTTTAIKQSSIELIDPKMENGNYVIEGGAFAPAEAEYRFSDLIQGREFFELRKSGIEFQSNGNLLITESTPGRISELLPNGELGWSYLNPSGRIVHDQFEIGELNNSIFRAMKYPLDFPAFTGKDLVPMGIIENENDFSANCITGNSDEEVLANRGEQQASLQLINPVVNKTLQIFALPEGRNEIKVYNMKGQQVAEAISTSANCEISLDSPTGLYWVRVNTGNSKLLEAKVIVAD